MSVYRIGNKSSESPFPKIRPTLDLDFANSKTLDPRITFRRASGGSYFGPDGRLRYAGVNIPRFDHDPLTGESLGLLVEEQRTNLLVRSEDFSTTWQTSLSSILTNAIAAPDGTITADKLVDTNDNNTHLVLQGTSSLAAGATVTASVYIKAGELSFASIGSPSGGTGTGINLLTGELVNVSVPGWTNAPVRSVTDAGNGWWRLSYQFTATGGNSLFDALRIFTNNGTSTFYTGDGTSGIYLWGAQIEEGAFPTSYIPTTTATVTRAADVASISGSNYSGWINLNNGTLFNDSKVIAPDVQTQVVWSLTGGTYVTSLRQPQNSADKFRAQISNTFTPTPGTGDTLSSGARKACVAYSGTAGRLQVGSSSNDVTAGGVLDATDFYIGSLAGGASLNGTIRRLTYWPQRLSNATLQRLTR